MFVDLLNLTSSRIETEKGYMLLQWPKILSFFFFCSGIWNNKQLYCKAESCMCLLHTFILKKRSSFQKWLIRLYKIQFTHTHTHTIHIRVGNNLIFYILSSILSLSLCVSFSFRSVSLPPFQNWNLKRIHLGESHFRNTDLVNSATTLLGSKWNANL